MPFKQGDEFYYPGDLLSHETGEAKTVSFEVHGPPDNIKIDFFISQGNCSFSVHGISLDDFMDLGDWIGRMSRRIFRAKNKQCQQ